MNPAETPPTPPPDLDALEVEVAADFLGLEPGAVERAREIADALGRTVVLVHPANGPWRVDSGELPGALVSWDGAEIRLPIPSRLPR